MSKFEIWFAANRLRLEEQSAKELAHLNRLAFVLAQIVEVHR